MTTRSLQVFLYRILISACLFSFSLASNAQADVIATKSAKESLQFAQDYYSKGLLQKAKRQLLHTIKVKKNFAIAHRLLGKVYFDLEEFDEAIEAFEYSFELDDKLSRAAFFECAEAYMLQEKIDLAQHYFTQFKIMKGKRYANAEKESALEKIYDDRLPVREQNILFIQQVFKGDSTIQVINLGKNINSKHDEYLPSITSDGVHLLFTRDVKQENENILLSNYKNGNWSTGSIIGGDLNTSNNEGMAKFEAHGNTFYFAGCKREAEDAGCDIYQALFDNGKVKEITPLDGRLNSFFWDSQPSISCDGKLLFFSSTREGGFGGSDIWVSRQAANGDWGVPENLGPKINTPRDEEAPFIATDGVTLYFTSNGHPGQGNGDIFVSYWENNAWSLPDNLGHLINSPAKELGIYIQGDNKTAYFASARKGGEGGLDIYSVNMPSLFQPQPMVQLEGYVLDKATQTPIETSIKISNDGNDWNIETNEDGWFFHCLSGEKGYSFQIHEEGYTSYIDAVYLEAQDNKANQMLTIELEAGEPSKPKEEAPKEEELVEKTPYQGANRLTKTVVQIYFDFDSTDINEKNQNKLNKVAQLIEEYGDWTVKVEGFADNVGDETYNKRLSQQRANEVVRFLNDKTALSIPTNINVIGKGAVQANDDESRRQNRRVDVVLTR